MRAFRPPTRRSAVSFWLRARLLSAHRAWIEGWRPVVGAWRPGSRLSEAPVLATFRSPLWTDAPAEEFALVAGKVHNLRVAASRLDGLEVAAGGTFSFWKQVGRPVAARGFVAGREVRAGCVVPSIAGGICQLSGSLATCAARAGLTLVERHGHTRVPDAAVAGPLDATVFWRHVDLRLRAGFAWRLGVELTPQELIVTVRGHATVPAAAPETGAAKTLPGAMRSCVSCNEVACFRHRPGPRVRTGAEAWLLDVWTPEFADWLAQRPGIADLYVPVAPRQWLARATGRGLARSWLAFPVAAGARRVMAYRAAARRTWIAWRSRKRAGARQAAVIEGQRQLALAYARALRPDHTHLVVDQGLLPHLQQLGVLGGRSYTVLASALPMDAIEQRLDAAAQHATDAGRAASLIDYRAPLVLRRCEREALARASEVVTPHTSVATYLAQSGPDGRPVAPVRCLPWRFPPACPLPRRDRAGGSPVVVFPASALARKGAYDLAAALRGLRCTLRVLGSPSDDETLWQGIQVEQGGYAEAWLAQADVVVLPAYVEHNPRGLLMALAAGMRVIATPECGIPPTPGLTLVPAGERSALRRALIAALDAPRGDLDHAASTGAEACPT